MAITMGSDSYIEILLKNALIQAGIEFEEQYRIYEKGDSYHPKYVVDFLVKHKGKAVAVECDSRGYHSSDVDVDRNIQRDRWLQRHGYGKVLHFSTYQLTSEMDTVIYNIQYALNMGNVPSHLRKFKGRKKPQKTYVENITRKALHQVELYYSYSQLKDRVWLAYKFYDKTLDRWSEERTTSLSNIAEKRGHEAVLLTMLGDLNQSVQLLVYCPSQWMTDHFNQQFKCRSVADSILNKVEAILVQHNYLFWYINVTRSAAYYDCPEPARLIYRELKSRCLQLRHQALEQRKN